MVLLHDEEESLMEDKRNNEAQGAHTCRNPKRHISLVRLLLCEMVAAYYFVWALDLQLWLGSE